MDKRKLSKLAVVLLIFAVWRWWVRSGGEVEMQHLEGTTMGRIPYSIKYFDKKNRDFSSSVEQLLKAFNVSLSTYMPESELSRLNKFDSIEFESEYLYPVLRMSREVYENTRGAFDPTVGLLVNAWGFGPAAGQEQPDSVMVDSLLAITGFDEVKFDRHKASKKTGMYLDFSAIAKGNAVDLIADFLEQEAIDDYMVEIGGEVLCRGAKPGGLPWMIGVEQPALRGEPNQLQAKVQVINRAVATSGNYRNYYLNDEGSMIAHTISPFTGYPVFHNLLSASVFAENCTLADAYATACMVMGAAWSKQLMQRVEGLDAFLIYSDEQGEYQTWISAGIEEDVELIE